jgi:hypothetical protein
VSFVDGNSVRYTDPSGHCLANGYVFDSGSSVCQHTHNGQDKDDPTRLSKYGKRGSGQQMNDAYK